MTMAGLPSNPSEAVRKINPHLYPMNTLDAGERAQGAPERPQPVSEATILLKGDRASVMAWKPEDNLNLTERRYLAKLRERHADQAIGIQCITLRLSKDLRYTPDICLYNDSMRFLRFIEVKGPHRFREKGILKVKMAARLYPQFDFWLCEWDLGGNKAWKETLLSKT